MPSHALADLPWTEVQSALERDQRLIFAVGALEQHGPHLPLGANLIIARHVAEEVSASLGILHAPTFSYGVTIGRGPFAGRAGLRRKTLHRAVNELLADWEDVGFEHFVLVSVHRFEPHLEALLMAMTSKAKRSVFDLYEVDVADILEREPEAEHAGELETSLMLHLAPELVRTDAVQDFVPKRGPIRRYTRRRVPAPPKGGSGVVGFPAAATPDKGRRIFERWVEALTETLRDESAAG